MKGMRIAISEPLCPFSHNPGTTLIIPGTFLRLRVFPTRLQVEDCSSNRPEPLHVFDFQLTGRVKDFTAKLDLERGMVTVSGHFKEGFVRYRIAPAGDPLACYLQMEKCRETGVRIASRNLVLFPKSSILITPESLTAGAFSPVFKKNEERLSLGCHKLQDFDLAKRRASLVEILPFWHFLGKNLPTPPSAIPEGNVQMLETIERSLIEKNKLGISGQLLDLFFAGFDGILSPRLKDEDFQGIGTSEAVLELKASPLVLLTEGAKLITRLFFEISENMLCILPLLPPEFHSGRMLKIAAGNFGEVDIEWSKKTIRRLVFRVKISGTVCFSFQKGIKSFRLRTSMKEKGKRLAAEEPLSVKESAVYFFDNFQK